MVRERKDATVFAGTYKGHELIIREMVWSNEAAKLAPDLNDYYCGYVELLPSDYYYDRLNEAEDELEVFGGITYTSNCGDLPVLPLGKKFVGFDTAHAFQPHFTFDTVKQDCFSLIDQIIERNYDTPVGGLC